MAKLSQILEQQINERKILVDAPKFHTRGKVKIKALEDPSPTETLRYLDSMGTNDGMRGWLAPTGNYLWDKDDANHSHMAEEVGVNPKKSVAFYLMPIHDSKGQTYDVSVDTSEFSGSSDDVSLVYNSQLMIGLMKLLEERNAIKEPESDDNDFSDILSSLGSGDY